MYELNLGIRWYYSDTVAFSLSGLNVLADDNRSAADKAADKDPKSVLIGISWINPL